MRANIMQNKLMFRIVNIALVIFIFIICINIYNSFNKSRVFYDRKNNFSMIYPSIWTEAAGRDPNSNEFGYENRFPKRLLCGEKYKGATFVVYASKNSIAHGMESWANTKNKEIDVSGVSAEYNEFASYDLNEDKIDNTSRAIVVSFEKDGINYALEYYYPYEKQEDAKYEQLFDEMIKSFRFIRK